jgi:hypothetical protein
MSLRPALVATAAMLLLAGCQAQRPASTTQRYSVDFRGAAKTCSPPKDVTAAAGKTTEAAMSVVNDGGWCAMTLDNSGKPYDAGLLTSPPTHGKVYIHKVGDDTRIDYTPDSGFVGADQFTLKLVPTDAVLSLKVTVSR